MQLNLREYQQRGLDLVKQAVKEGKKRILVVAPTGSGKGHLAAAIMQAADTKSKSSIFTVHRREIIRQLSKKLSSVGVDHGIILSGHKKSMLSTTHIASMQTLIRREFPPADILIIDEAHRALCRTYEKIISNYRDSLLIAFTATPCRSDGRGLGGVFDCLIQFTSVRELTEKGFLVPIVPYAPARPDLEKIKIKRGDYDAVGLEKAMDQPKLIGDIVDNWLRLARGRKTMVFASGVSHSKHLVEHFEAVGVRAAHIDGETPDELRDGIIDRLRSGEIDVICNMGVYTEGVDVPEVSCVVLARPTKSFGTYLQMAGRGLRPAPGKTDMILIDHSGCIYDEEHGLPDQDITWTLEPGKQAHTKKAETEKREALPWICQHCFHVNQPSKEKMCEACHLMHAGKSDAPVVGEGRLVRLGNRRAAKSNLNSPEKVWNDCFWKAKKLGMKVGAAAHMYKKKMGVFPRGIDGLPKGSEWKMTAEEFYTMKKKLELSAPPT